MMNLELLALYFPQKPNFVVHIRGESLLRLFSPDDQPVIFPKINCVIFFHELVV